MLNCPTENNGWHWTNHRGGDPGGPGELQSNRKNGIKLTPFVQAESVENKEVEEVAEEKSEAAGEEGAAEAGETAETEAATEEAPAEEAAPSE